NDRSGDLMSPVIGIEFVVAEILPDVAMEVVGPRLEGGANDSALEIPEFGGGVLGDQVEFLDGVGSRCVPQEVVGNLVIVHAVQQKVVRLFAVPIDVWAATTVDVVPIVKAGGIWCDRAGRQ